MGVGEVGGDQSQRHEGDQQDGDHHGEHDPLIPAVAPGHRLGATGPQDGVEVRAPTVRHRPGTSHPPDRGPDGARRNRPSTGCRMPGARSRCAAARRPTRPRPPRRGGPGTRSATAGPAPRRRRAGRRSGCVRRPSPRAARRRARPRGPGAATPSRGRSSSPPNCAATERGCATTQHHGARRHVSRDAAAVTAVGTVAHARRRDHRIRSIGRGGPGRGGRGRRLRRDLVGRGQPRPVPPPGPGGRAHGADPGRHRHRRGVRPQPDDPRRDRQRPPDGVGGTVHARSRVPDQAAHREAVLDAVVPPRPPDAGADPGHPGDLGLVGRRQPAGLPWRVLPPHPDDPDVRPGSQPLRQPADLPGRRGQPHDRGRRRGGRRAPGPRLHHRALPARGDGAGRRTGSRHERAGPLGIPDLVPRAWWSPGSTRRRWRRRWPPPASSSPSTAPPPPTGRSSSSTDGATCRRTSTPCRSVATGTPWPT